MLLTSVKQLLCVLFGTALMQGAMTNGSDKVQPKAADDPVNWYEYYAAGGNVTEGLVADGDHFSLNGLEFQIFSGAVHYFRVHPAYWRTTLRKLRAAGLNTVETYVAWNLHEPQMDTYDFGDGDNDMSEFLDLPGYLKMAQEEDLFVILRPGPYICSEWDFGGLPSYLLREREYNVHVRSFDQFYLGRAEKWLNQLLPKVVDMQFTKGGPIIAVQIENEFGHFGYGDFPRDLRYLAWVKQQLETGGITELLFTSDSPVATGDLGALPGVLQTANFQKDPAAELEALRKLQPDRPAMTMEFWTGWFDHWLAPFKAGLSPDAFRNILDIILQSNSSVNMYMFMGGTNFGFMAGANWVNANPNFTPDTTSYDYDSPLTEGGCYTEKYNITKELLQKYGIVKNLKPVDAPPENAVKAFDFVALKEAIPLEGLRAQLTPEEAEQPLAMENLSVNNGSGQSYGLVWYRANVTTSTGSVLKIRGHVRDVALVVIDGELLTRKPENIQSIESFGYWPIKDGSVALTCAAGEHTLDILVENMGRANYGEPHILDSQRKGLPEGSVEIDEKVITGWEIYPMEMKKEWINSLQEWTPLEEGASVSLPTMLRGTLTVDEPADTYLDMRQLTKGIVFVNGFNLGRYLIAGPVFTLYLPAPLLTAGDNQIVVFEEFGSQDLVVNFSDKPITLETKTAADESALFGPH